MSHAELQHADRPTLQFRQGQDDSDESEAVANIANPRDGQPPIVVIETYDRRFSITGLVTAPRRASNDPDTSDWQQALANYVDLLEAHVDEFQGSGYDFVNTEREFADAGNTDVPCVLESIEWTLEQGAPYEIEFTANMIVGEGLLETEAIERRNPTVDTGMDVVAQVGAANYDLPGMRRFRSQREVSINPISIYDTDSAENNDNVLDGGTSQRWVIEGTHTGAKSDRADADKNLRTLQGSQTTLSTRFPGYDVQGFVMDYSSDFQARLGRKQHHYTLTFMEGNPA